MSGRRERPIAVPKRNRGVVFATGLLRDFLERLRTLCWRSGTIHRE